MDRMFMMVDSILAARETECDRSNDILALRNSAKGRAVMMIFDGSD